jgi:two-component system, NarL family, invasion response regulator UvrY
MTTIAMADDHKLIRQSLADMITTFGGYQIVLQADNGRELTSQIHHHVPDLVLLDVRMPEMDGFQTATWLQAHYPAIKILALTMMDDDFAIVKMLKAGAKGYVLKDAEPAELKTALYSVVNKGFYFNDMVTGKLVHTVMNGEVHQGNQHDIKLSAKEEEFLKLVSTELTYKEIAERMFVSPRTIDGYRDGLFEKLNIKSRVGLVLFSLKRGISQL